MASPVTWNAEYFDGRAAGRYSVAVTARPEGLYIRKLDGDLVFWPYAEIRRVQGGSRTGEQVRLERGPREALVFSGQATLRAVRDSNPAIRCPAFRPRQPWWWKPALVAAIGLVTITPVMYFWGLPAAGELAATLVPVAFEERLGQAVVEALAPGGKRCSDPRVADSLAHISRTLAVATPDSPYRFQVLVSDNPEVNAFAAPGGYIVVFRGLLERAGQPEEVAGVLAHEMQHVLRRHSTKAIFRHLALWALISALTGDPNSLASGLAGSLGGLRFQRSDEDEADRLGMEMIQKARIDPRGMVRFFVGLEKEAGAYPRALAYLSTHPHPRERVQKLQRLAAQAGYAPVELKGDWRGGSGSCR